MANMVLYTEEDEGREDRQDPGDDLRGQKEGNWGRKLVVEDAHWWDVKVVVVVLVPGAAPELLLVQDLGLERGRDEDDRENDLVLVLVLVVPVPEQCPDWPLEG